MGKSKEDSISKILKKVSRNKLQLKPSKAHKNKKVYSRKRKVEIEECHTE